MLRAAGSFVILITLPELPIYSVVNWKHDRDYALLLSPDSLTASSKFTISL